jgi:hypothetical protein
MFHADQTDLPMTGGLTLNSGKKNVDKPKARITAATRLLVLLKGFIGDSQADSVRSHFTPDA